jgi:hypothetical protein
MEKIDRLGWTAGIAFESYGLKIGVRVSDPAALERVRSCLPPGWQPARSPDVDYLMSLRIGGASGRPNIRNYSLLYGGLARLARTMDQDELFQTLENELQLFVAEWATNRVFVHAGVVAWKGRAIVIPGRTLAGKSTLVAALLEAGATYYSDEYAVLDGRTLVHPYPRPLSLRQAGGARPQRLRAENLGSSVGTAPLPIGVVAVTRYLPGSSWRPRLLTPGTGALELLNHTIPTLRAPERVLTTLNRLAPRARLLKGPRGEARETAHLLLRELER